MFTEEIRYRWYRQVQGMLPAEIDDYKGVLLETLFAIL
jgi:hypothetical protein